MSGSRDVQYRVSALARRQASCLRAASSVVIVIAVVAAIGCAAPRTDEVSDAFGRYYMAPRAYPSEVVELRHRVAALAHLAEMHVAGEPHRNSADASSADVSSCIWTSIGPTNINGRITSIAIDTLHGERIFVATVGGVWRSIDSGRNWERVLTEARPGVFGAVAVHALGAMIVAGGGDPNHQVAGSGGGPGIWLSLDGGDTWAHEPAPELDDAVIYRIMFSPDAVPDIYAATSKGVWWRHDVAGQARWTLLDGMNAPCSDIAIDFSHDEPRVYAGVYEERGAFNRRIWKHDESGWNERSNGILTGSRMIGLTLCLGHPEVLYAKLERRSNQKLLGVYCSQDGGGNWERRSDASLDDSNTYTWYNCVIQAHPTMKEIVYVGGVNLYRSKNQGIAWSAVTGSYDDDYKAARLHVDQHAITFDPSNENILYVGNDGGVFRTTDLSRREGNRERWRWENIAHGLTISEFYRVGTRSGRATIVAGGSQDNGTEFTFGNRTWYPNLGSDGGYVAVDAANLIGIYQSQGGELVRYDNPVPGKAIWQNAVTWTQFPDPHEPVATDASIPNRAVAVSWAQGQRPRLRLTVDGRTWRRLGDTLPDAACVTALAIGHMPDSNTFYVGFRGETEGVTASIWASTDRGESWIKPDVFPDLSTNGIVVDMTNPRRAFAAVGGAAGAGGAVLMTQDHGESWTDISGVGPKGLPETPMTGVVIDPRNRSVLYASSFVGVFKGTLDAAGVAAEWVPFDDGLPEGLDVNDIAINAEGSLLTIGTRGYGAYQRYVGDDACPRERIMVRDNVFDRGTGESVHGVANPEDPVDYDHDGRYEPNPDVTGLVYWWTSSDIRVTVPARVAPSHRIDFPDHVEFETCALASDTCPPGVIEDVSPRPGDQARVFVQVTNAGLQPLENVKVTVLWAEGVVPGPDLPQHFWNRAFVGGSGSCGDIVGNSGWNYLNMDSGNRCQTIPRIAPGMPQVVAFMWDVPASSSGTYQYLAIIESASAPLGTARGVRALDALVPVYHQVAQRALKVVPPSALISENLTIAPSGGLAGTEISVSAGSVGPSELFGVLLPTTPGMKAKGGTSVSALSFVGDTAFVSSGLQLARFRVDSSMVITNLTGPQTRMSLTFMKSLQGIDRPRFLNVVIRRAGKVLGGMRYLVRPGP